MRIVLPSLDEVFGEAKRRFSKVLESQESLKREEMGTTREFQLANYPTPLEDQETCEKLLQLRETTRRKFCASLTANDGGKF